MDERLKPILEELHSRFEVLYGDRLIKMVLYGSQARGDAEPGSDIDVLVVLKGEVDSGEEIDRTIEIVAGLSLEHNEAIVCVFISEDRFKSERSPLMLNVRREGVPV